MPMPRAFDGYVELLARVSSTGLVHLERNRYSVPTEHAHSAVSLRLYPDTITAVADGVQVASHPRSFERSQTFYDWRHYISLVERKPGGLRNGAPFESMPDAFKQLQAVLLKRAGGDAVMAQVLCAVPIHGLEAVLVAAELALEAGKPSGEHVLNILARLKGSEPGGSAYKASSKDMSGSTSASLSAAMVLELLHMPLKLITEPLANVDRYDALRTSGGAR